MTHDTPSPQASAPGIPLGAQLEQVLLTLPAPRRMRFPSGGVPAP